VVPTYNEKENVEPLVLSLEGAGTSGLSVLFVDDGSPDGTADEVKRVASSRPWVSLHLRERKMGIGSAYQEGFKLALSRQDASVLVEMDADLQHPASALAELVEAVRAGADVVVGSRYVPGGGISGWSRGRRALSKGANAYSRGLLGLPVKDATSGFRAYSRRAAQTLADAKLPAKGFEFQVASLHLLKGSFQILEVPYVFSSRAAGKSKLGVGDIARFLFGVARIALT
jgi:dolichol-phosphate mannosyltransferase